MLAACTSESENGPSANISYESIAATQQVPVTFGTYMGETPVTRGTGAINTNALLQAAKLGVFATYSDGTGSTDGSYSATTGPNFMYNQQVTFTLDTDDDGNPDAWTYSPIKYWPNETKQDGQTTAATSSHTDKLSFFAYAPYKSSFSATGITGLTTNTATTDPKVSYSTGNALNEDDLLWGVANPAANVTWTSVDGTTTVNVPKGMPFLNLIKPNKSAAVKFYMRHALAGLKLTVQGVYDEESLGSNTLADRTYITIEGVTITATLPTSGVLNLNNTVESTPLWEDNTTTASTTFTLNTSDLEENLQYNSSATTYFGAGSGTEINPGVGRNSLTGAAITTAQNVIAQTSGATPVDRYFMFVPPASTPSTADDIDFEFNIVYHVWTYDEALNGYFAKVKNDITKTITINNVAGGKMYTVNMLLGLTSVKLDAAVVDWTDDTNSSVDLPRNED